MTDLSENRPVARADLRRLPIGRWLSARNIGAVYVWLLIVLLFSIISPDTFPTAQTGKAILNQYAITGMVALSLVVPLAAGLYDLSIGSTVSLSGVLIAYVLEHTSLSPVIAGVLVIAACVLVGLVNAFIVSVLRVSSFIATLGTGAIMTAITSALSGNEIITGRVGNGYTKLATTNLGGIQIQVLYMIVIMIALGYWLERTDRDPFVCDVGRDLGICRDGAGSPGLSRLTRCWRVIPHLRLLGGVPRSHAAPRRTVQSMGNGSRRPARRHRKRGPACFWWPDVDALPVRGLHPDRGGGTYFRRSRRDPRRCAAVEEIVGTGDASGCDWL
jgi:hypothetical protein